MSIRLEICQIREEWTYMHAYNKTYGNILLLFELCKYYYVECINCVFILHCVGLQASNVYMLYVSFKHKQLYSVFFVFIKKTIWCPNFTWKLLYQHVKVFTRHLFHCFWSWYIFFSSFRFNLRQQRRQDLIDDLMMMKRPR